MKAKDRPEPTLFVLFGGTGDLAWRKLVPALFDLYIDGHLPNPFGILAVGRAEFDDASLSRHYREGVDRHSRRGENTMWLERSIRRR